MRFSVVAVSMFAGAAMAATSTDYVTEEVTITSCAATVTDCPARSTQVSTTIYSRTSSTEAAPSSVTPAGQPSNSGPVASGPASSAPASSAPATSVLVPVSSAPAPSASPDVCAATCTTEYNTCRSAPNANRALCASSYASCLGYSPYDSNGSLVTPTACSGASATSAPASSAPASSAPASSAPASVCAATCTTEYNTCRSAPNANRALCASSYASCLGYSPYDSNGSLVTPTACSSGASATSAPASSAPASSAPASSAPASSTPASDVCAATCTTEYNTCRSAPNANRALCASSYASCLGYSPYDSNGSLVTPTACSSGASATSAPASSAPASFTPTYATPAASSAGSSLGVVASSPAPSVSVVAITTCIPTVIYSTISLSGLETSAPGVPAASAKPSSTGYISVPANGTSPAATQTPLTFTGAAANLQVGGAAIAAVFGLAAFLL